MMFLADRSRRPVSGDRVEVEYEAGRFENCQPSQGSLEVSLES